MTKFKSLSLPGALALCLMTTLACSKKSNNCTPNATLNVIDETSEKASVSASGRILELGVNGSFKTASTSSIMLKLENGTKKPLPVPNTPDDRVEINFDTKIMSIEDYGPAPFQEAGSDESGNPLYKVNIDRSVQEAGEVLVKEGDGNIKVCSSSYNATFSYEESSQTVKSKINVNLRLEISPEVYKAITEEMRNSNLP